MTDQRTRAVGIDECLDNGGDCRICEIQKRCKEYLASLNDEELTVKEPDADEELKIGALRLSFGRLFGDRILLRGIK